MIRFLADEDADGRLVGALRRVSIGLDLVTVEEVGLCGTPDPGVLAWAATTNRVVVTHDVNTFPAHAYARVRNGLPMPGVIAVPRWLSRRVAVDDIVTIARRDAPAEMECRVLFLPLDKAWRVAEGEPAWVAASA